jgi:hypothetical protein
LKYGVSNADEIALYELGFADRIVASRIRMLIANDPGQPVRARLRENAGMEIILAGLPRYFRECFEGLAH